MLGKRNEEGMGGTEEWEFSLEKKQQLWAGAWLISAVWKRL